jgi:hypothetical protein
MAALSPVFAYGARLVNPSAYGLFRNTSSGPGSMQLGHGREKKSKPIVTQLTFRIGCNTMSASPVTADHEADSISKPSRHHSGSRRRLSFRRRDDSQCGCFQGPYGNVGPPASSLRARGRSGECDRRRPSVYRHRFDVDAGA